MSDKGLGGYEAFAATGIVAVCMGVAIIFIGVFLIIPFSIAALVFGIWWFHDRYKNSDRKLEEQSRIKTMAMYEDAIGRAISIKKMDFGQGVYARLPKLPEDIDDLAIMTVFEIYDLEGWSTFIPEPPAYCNSIEGARYRDYIAKVSGFTHKDLEDIQAAIVESLTPILHFGKGKPTEGEFFQPLHSFADSDASRPSISI